MSVADKITQLVSDISSSYQKIQSKGGSVPTDKNTNNLPNAIDSIPIGSDPVITPIEITENGTYTAPENVDGYSPVVVNVPSIDTGKNGLYRSLLLNTATEFVDDTITEIGSVSFMANRTSLVYVSLPNVATTGAGSKMFQFCTNLKIVDLKNYPLTSSTGVSNRNFEGCTSLVYARFGDSIGTGYACFPNSIKTLNFKSLTQYANDGHSVSVCKDLRTLILGGKTVTTLININYFNTQSPIALGTGSIYVPDKDADGNDLPSQYKSATNWNVDPIVNCIKGYSEAPNYTSGTHTVGDVVKLNEKVYVYSWYVDTEEAPSGTTDDTKYWHYVGEVE